MAEDIYIYRYIDQCHLYIISAVFRYSHVKTDAVMFAHKCLISVSIMRGYVIDASTDFTCECLKTKDKS